MVYDPERGCVRRPFRSGVEATYTEEVLINARTRELLDEYMRVEYWQPMFRMFWTQVAIWYLLAKIRFMENDDFATYDPHVSGVAAWHYFWQEIAQATLWQTIWDMGTWGGTPEWADAEFDIYAKGE